MADKYTDTLNLPKTDFPMRGGLPTKEPEMLAGWEKTKLYNKREEKRATDDREKTFILHDGPPFANGDIHTGHALNKILKDIILKSKSMQGYATPYTPGWDTHGLPIERQAIQKTKVNKDEISKAEFRKICKDFAVKYSNNQREQFKRLGVLADFDNPYLTLKPEYEAEQIRIFGKMVGDGFIYTALKPVYWCTTCETALAEAEIEYENDKTDSIYVSFDVVKDNGLGINGAKIIIWTTTTWTLPANVAISLNPLFDYVLVEAGGEKYIVAESLLDSTMQAGGIDDYKVLKTFKGQELDLVECAHPFLDRNSLVIVGGHVTADSGTGCVHTAPGHGAEDYIVCQNYPQIPIVVPLDGDGKLNEEAGPFAGMYYLKSNTEIVHALKESGHLFALEEIEHQYPHCWRCHSPIAFRATKQWFCNVDSLKKTALEEIKKVKWLPKWGEERIASMVEGRADWCISRQRLWGVPIPIFKCVDCEKPTLDKAVIDYVADIFEKEGAQGWFEHEVEELLPNGYKCSCGCAKFEKETDTMDVWFDSGTSHAGVLKHFPNLSFPADVYLEGNDQYRGWFQSSVLTSVADTGKAPYKEVITHGMVVDGEGKKMSKSLGNGIDPIKDICDVYGADILRLWVAGTDYTGDVRISQDIIKQLSEIYRKIRNTSRFCLGNIYDFDADSVFDTSVLSELDNYILAKLQKLVNDSIDNYNKYDFHNIYQDIHNFCVSDLSNFYLDINKDVLYTFAADSIERKSCQYVMAECVVVLAKLLAPILSFTADEIWAALGNDESIHLEDFPIKKEIDEEIIEKFDRFRELRAEVSLELEKARESKLIGNSLEAYVELSLSGKEYEFLNGFKNLKELFIVSGFELKEGEKTIKVSKYDGKKCPRCWMYHSDSGEICEKCAGQLGA
ncbi:isoleucine--tRNA ligase [Treponema sp. R6D11]